MRTAPRHRLSRTAVLALAAAAVLLVGVAGAAIARLGAGPKSSAAHPPPLYPAAALRVVQGPLAAADRRADADAARWLAANPRATDAAFMAWAQSQIPAPPAGAAARRELAFLHGLSARTPAGDTAATWLEAHGPKDVWKLYDKQYGQLVGKARAAKVKKALKATLAAGKAQQALAKDRFARLSPYLVDRSLDAVHQGKFTRKFSYPSKHATMAVAAETLLARVEPLRAAELQRSLQEILYSRLYARGHYPSDLVAGERLGRLIADYEIARAGL